MRGISSVYAKIQIHILSRGASLQSIPLALTYDDVLLVPSFSSIETRRNVDCATRFTRQIPLKTPFISADMDTVTEAPMAIAMALFGGIGVIHRFLPVEAHAAEVTRVKQHSNNDGEASTWATRDDNGRLRVAAAVGVVGDFLERAHALRKAGVDALVIDIAHGDSALMLSAIGQLREQLGQVPLVAGNVATPEGAQRLVEAGVDAIKVGVGPGSMCITRQVSGVGVPQFTAVLETSQVARAGGVPLIADGGIRFPGDVAKAVGAGASTVMLGNLLAGTDESPGKVVERSGRKVKISRGMASKEASLDRALRDDPDRGRARWESEEADVAAEGVQALVHYRGSAADVLQALLWGLRSGMSYCGAGTIDEMQSKAVFVRQTEAGLREAGPHDVVDQ